MSLATSNRDGGRTNEAGHLRSVSKAILGQVLTGLNVSQRAAGANMSVDVAIGDALIQRSDGTYGHPAWNDAVYNQVVAAADGSNPRRDIIVMYIDYNQAPSTGVANNTNGVVKITSVSGTAAGSPVDPSNATIQAAVGSGNPWIKLGRVRLAAGATSISNSVIDDLREMATGLDNNGWISVPNSEISGWSYSSWSGTTRVGVITVPTNATLKYNVGNRLRIVQATGGTKYGIIIAVSATTLTVFFAAGTTLNNEAILSPYFSRVSTPLGFDKDPALWTLEIIETTSRTVANPPAVTGGVWAATGMSLVIPAGKWRIAYMVNYNASGASSTIAGYITLATSTSVPANHPFNGLGYKDAAGQIYNTVYIEKVVNVPSQKTWQIYVGRGGSVLTQMQITIPDATQASFIRAICAYL